MKNSKTIRHEFLDFFKNKSHKVVPSSPVIPKDDPTLLFTNAGMNQFKDVFLGIGNRPYKRAVNSQKCIRVSGKHNDLEEVGSDTYHHTFFEMLGNWSFGDYYKREAIQWAWELLTEVWNLNPRKLWATVFKDDDEAEEFWKSETNIEHSQILRFDEADNFWEMGETGPCGPSSEIHIDLGEEYCDKKYLKNHNCHVNGDCGRYIELWNLVFIQYNRDENGKLHSLPQKHVDTGMGFERIVAILQGVNSNYNTDLFLPIINKVEEISSFRYNETDESRRIAFRVLADHIRMLTFSITDGAIPSNEGRGYVLRRILRRASRFARKLDLHEPIIYELVPIVVEIMAEAFPEILQKKKHVMDVIRSEEENFNKTLDRGIEIFDNLANNILKNGQRIIPGEEAFRLYDTYGFPLDLTRVMAEEKNMTVDEEGFDSEMEKQRERARQAGKFSVHLDQVDQWNVLHHCASNSVFVGYENLSLESEICKFAFKGGKFHFVLAETPFYPEGGGQVADKGRITVENVDLKVVDVKREGSEIIHICEGPEDLNIIHARAKAEVDSGHRFPTMYNHTTTHLLHEALRRVLGKHVQQAGSLVSPERLRFDFTHYKKIEREELEEIERIVNEQIRKDISLDIFYTDIKKAREMGVIALFDEKYEEQVRVITIGDFSRELCGGTHVNHTGQIGSFIIVEESGIASGVRRIEALTGPAAIEFMQKTRNILSNVSQILNTSYENITDKLKILSEQIRDQEKRLQKIQTEEILSRVDEIIAKSKKIGKISLGFHIFHDIDMDLLKQVADRFRQKTHLGVLLLVNQTDDKLNFVYTITDDLVKEGYHAGKMLRDIAKITGGGGGGRAHLATAGGKNPDKLDAAIQHLEKILNKREK
ncbi:MAG: alanine--tRNA ligase [Calditrichaeota bacterium]|nr:alanine--tRNA ligase [Calditrichota bacterium]